MPHTPGPWKAMDCYDYATVESVTEDGRMVLREICTCLIDTDEESGSEEEDRANAYLIAAAPALLAACQEALRELKELGFERGRAIEALEAAIALAAPAKGGE